VRLLFDENLSPDLPRLLAEIFPLSAHVRDKNLIGADDLTLWQFAAANGFALVTKDDDFVELSILRGAPPKVILIGLGNCRTSDVVTLLKAEHPKLEQFAGDAAASIIQIP
jgi:predicted nuclease of predicted toxin-antitoxin system